MIPVVSERQILDMDDQSYPNSREQDGCNDGEYASRGVGGSRTITGRRWKRGSGRARGGN